MLAAIDGILRGLLRARIVEVILVPERHGDITLFDVIYHLGVKLGLKLACGLHDGVGIGILLLQKGDHLRAGLFPKPGVVVDQPVPMDGGCCFLLARNRWLYDNRLQRGHI